VSPYVRENAVMRVALYRIARHAETVRAGQERVALEAWAMIARRALRMADDARADDEARRVERAVELGPTLDVTGQIPAGTKGARMSEAQEDPTHVPNQDPAKAPDPDADPNRDADKPRYPAPGGAGEGGTSRNPGGASGPPPPGSTLPPGGKT
jgi:hypothetical protein